MVCGGPRTPYDEITLATGTARVRNFSRCLDGCGFISVEELPGDRYRSKTSMDQLHKGRGTRVGTEDRCGREFFMARMGLEILGGHDNEVLVYGAGRSLDNRHIAGLERAGKVAIADIMRLRDDGEFHDANEPASKTFPLVIASEVVEHFRRPREDFARLLEFVSKDGLLICSTNIYGGGDLTKDPYPFWNDHTAYYTPEALSEIARAHGFALDFRTPRIAGQRGRKRYVMFTRSPVVHRRIALHFGRVALAPSEEPAS